jgi:hypothetical protein
MRTSALSALIAAVAATGALQAQNPTASDTGAAPMQQAVPSGQGPAMGPRAERLRMMIEERFAQRVQSQLNLDDGQMQKLREAFRADRDRRLHLRDEETDLRRAINEQMTPGVAANQDSLARLQDALVRNHMARAQLEQQQQRELSQFLTPVQRARLLQMRQNLQQRIQTIREGRWRAAPGGPGLQGRAPAARPRPRPGPR